MAPVQVAKNFVQPNGQARLQSSPSPSLRPLRDHQSRAPSENLLLSAIQDHLLDDLLACRLGSVLLVSSLLYGLLTPPLPTFRTPRRLSSPTSPSRSARSLGPLGSYCQIQTAMMRWTTMLATTTPLFLTGNLSDFLIRRSSSWRSSSQPPLHSTRPASYLFTTPRGNLRRDEKELSRSRALASRT